MLASRRRAVVRLGLWSTADQIRSPSKAKTIGTRCGAPSTPTVARRATLDPANRRRASSGSIPTLVRERRQVLEERNHLVLGEQVVPPLHDRPVGPDQVEPRLVEVAPAEEPVGGR